MAPVVPNPKKIRSFRSETAFEKWLATNHARETEVWLKIHKKASGLPTFTVAEALDVALCWGWIDGIRKGLDDTNKMKTAAGRARKIDELVRMLARGETIVPEPRR